jgi:predicted dehydrogenase
MNKPSIIVGMGIGQLYKDVLTKLGREVVTVDLDPNKGADYTSVDQAISEHLTFNTAHICTPNFTHAELTKKLSACANIVFVEKPGLRTSEEWQQAAHSSARVMMVKNNMWRSNINELRRQANQAKQVNIQWIRKNCIPHPGSWFTTRELAFGGVSRDLMPHLLSLFIALNPEWQEEKINQRSAVAKWQLKDIDSTEYGIINPNGTYDVDDCCTFNFGDKWRLTADWRSMVKEDSSIEFVMQDDSIERFELGWCPEEAYLAMIQDAVNNFTNSTFWNKQFEQDVWIHQMIENL